VVFLVLCHSLFLLSQEKRGVADSTFYPRDTLVTDTTLRSSGIAKGAIDKPITYGSRGYRRTDLVNKKVYLVQDAVVTYGDITLKADSIELDMETKSIFAIGRKDTAGKVLGSPNFTQGNESFDSKELTYNFNTGKARVINMVTKQEDGYLHSGVTKKFKDGTFNISKSTYSTCDLEHPHFYVGFNKAKVIPGKKIITGPAYMVLEDIPLPLVLPFGFFPIQTKKAVTGLIIPKISQSYLLGYSLREGGYYFAINDNFDLALIGDIYTNGTWTINIGTNYSKRYKFNGRFAFSFANNVSGHKGLSDYQKTNNYRLDWNYNQDSKANPGSRFAASVSMSSSSYDRQNSYVVSEHVNSTRQSSVSYAKTWTGTPFSFVTSLNHSQNVKNKTVALNLPKGTFVMSRIYPLKPKVATGPSKWWQELQFQYTASVDNQINTRDSLLFTKEVFKNMRNGFKHEAPMSLLIRPIKSKPGFTISPNISYSGVLYTRKYHYTWDAQHYDENTNKIVPMLVPDTLKGLFYGQAVSTSIGTSLAPQIYGTYQFKNPNSRVQKIRHIIKPTIGFSYVPYLKGLSSNLYQYVQYDTLGHKTQKSVFEGNIYGTPSFSKRNGSITFGLSNILEAKVFAKNDTTGKPKNVKIIDNFAINTSYSIFSDSLKWAPVSMSYRTVLFKNLNISTGAGFNLYGLDSKGRVHNVYYLEQEHKLMRLTNFQTSIDVDIGQLFRNKNQNKTQQTQQQQVTQQTNTTGLQDMRQVGEMGQGTSKTGESTALPLDKYGYVDWEIPWSMRVAWNFSVSRPSFATNISHTISLSGDVSITKKTKITYTTGFDVRRNQITMTTIGIYRDLHCWDLSVEWIPVGYMKSWSFTIKIKSSVLADIKYNRRKDFHDTY